MIRYPLSFKVESRTIAGMQTSWSSHPVIDEKSFLPVTVAIPPEFEGPGGGYSPEDFYALALANCFVATFKVIAEKSKLEYQDVHAEGTLTVDRDDKGSPWMKAFLLRVELKGATDVDRAKRLLEKTALSCMILNSVKTEKTFQFEVNS